MYTNNYEKYEENNLNTGDPLFVLQELWNIPKFLKGG